jgi:hypothetical protein
LTELTLAISGGFSARRVLILTWLRASAALSSRIDGKSAA